MRRILSVTAATIAICLIATAAYAQASSLRLRFHVPFAFSVKNKTFPAGDYEVTQPVHSVLNVRNLGNQTAGFETVTPALSRKEGDRRARVLFHRYDNEYFLAFISDGSRESAYDFQMSKEEMHLANANPRKPVTIVSITPNGTSEVASDLTRHAW
ncbi:MAG TPA: hypothetical protein VN749_10580 [Candidatus Eisenbacteria bacterium]|jgi:hypothetical protein|nr:hypothetical protein [Candidatus Eisenbacteria bacterium]